MSTFIIFAILLVSCMAGLLTAFADCLQAPMPLDMEGET